MVLFRRVRYQVLDADPLPGKHLLMLGAGAFGRGALLVQVVGAVVQHPARLLQVPQRCHKQVIVIGLKVQLRARRHQLLVALQLPRMGQTVLVLAVIYLAASAIIALGYSIFYFEVQLPNGSVGQLLDIMDYVSNSVMMPFIALLSTILIGWVMTPDYVIDEMQRNGETFRRKKLYRVMIRYVAPVMMLVLFLQSTGILA